MPPIEILSTPVAAIFLTDFREIDDLLDYFELFNDNLSKKTLNSHLKSVSNP